MNPVSNQRGETLLEIMVTILVMGIGMVAVVGALYTLIVGSDTHHGLAQGEVIVRDYGEAIKTKAIAASTFTSCPGVAQLTPSGFTFPSGWSATIDSVEWWVPTPTSFPNGTWSSTSAACSAFYTACGNANSSCGAGLQRVAFTATNSRTDYAHATIKGRVLTRKNNVP